MKTTVDIPDELMQRIKMRAVRNRQKLKDIVADLLESGMDNEDKNTRVKRLPKPLNLKNCDSFGIEDIENAIAGGRE